MSARHPPAALLGLAALPSDGVAVWAGKGGLTRWERGRAIISVNDGTTKLGGHGHRVNITARASTTDGSSWPHALRVCDEGGYTTAVMSAEDTLAVVLERSPPGDPEMMAVALVDMPSWLHPTPPAPPAPPAPTGPFGVVAPTWYLAFDKAILAPLVWAASRIPLWVIVCSDHGLGGAITPLCDRATPEARETDAAIAELRSAGAHILVRASCCA